MLPLKDNLTHGPLPRVTIALIAVNLLVLGWQLILPGTGASSPELAAEHVSKRDQAAIELGAIPFRLTHPGSECGVGSEGIVCGEDGLVEAGGTVGTLFLWIFGGAVESLIGGRRFLALFVAAAFGAAYAQSLLDPAATGPVIGAAGAVSGALGAYVVLRPRGRVVTVNALPGVAGLLEVPALLLIAAWFALQLLPGVGNLASTDIASGGTAYLAHVGGFAVGLAGGWLLARRGRLQGGSPAAPGAIAAG